MNAESTSFTLVKSQEITSLNIRYEEYQHKYTGATHIHLAADNSENVFLVALRTMPTDSTGVAHILEHTALCGSEKYPVRDPFFMMIRRSLNTFMNAFTSSDWTAYPFASQSKKDFDNLLDVYLDAVFFARLDPLDFAQEGHRLEFEETDNPDSKLVFKGVVFNEMKGAMSPVSAQLWQAVGKSLFPDTTYGVNSGGDPAAIPDLSYQQLKSFYQTHYHPDNAVFMTFGDIPAKELQLKFEKQALHKFSPEDIKFEVPLQTRFKQPVRVNQAYALGEDEPLENNCHRVMAWVINDIREPGAILEAQLLSSILLENSASPLQMQLETTELGKAPSPLCGLDDSGLETIFICGLEGCNEDQLEAFEQLILDTLENVVKEGIPYQRLVALLDQLELQQREISGDSYPYGLQLILSCIAPALHRGDAVAALDIDPLLNQLREAIKQPDYVSSLVKRLLLDNLHRVTLTLHPDTELSQKMIQEEADRLASIKSQLTDTEKQSIVQTANDLAKRQDATDDPELLPKVGLEDVPEAETPPSFTTKTIKQSPLTFYPQGTNGLTYRQVVTALPALNDEQLNTLGLHNRLLTEVGIGDKNYLDVQNWQTETCGSISAFSAIKGAVDNEQAISGYFTLSAKGLASRSEAIDELLHNTYRHARFDEKQRICELVTQSATHAEQSVTGSGHSLAMSVACQGYSPAAKLSHASSGMLGIQSLKALDKNLKEDKAFESFSSRLADLHQLLSAQQHQFLAIDESSQQDQVINSLSAHWDENKTTETTTFSLPSERQQTKELWVCNSQVNFCSKAYATVPAGHPDAAALTVLSGVLRNGFLHTAIREKGGAYGGGADQNSLHAAFRFYSYRDPRLNATLDDFDQSIAWLLETSHPWRTVEEAILGVVSSIDKPSSPAGRAKKHFHSELFGRTQEHQLAFRNAVLSVTEADLKRVAETYLQPSQASIGIITHAGEEAQYKTLCEAEGIAVKHL